MNKLLKIELVDAAGMGIHLMLAVTPLQAKALAALLAVLPLTDPAGGKATRLKQLRPAQVKAMLRRHAVDWDQFERDCKSTNETVCTCASCAARRKKTA